MVTVSEIYRGKLPRDLIQTLGVDHQAILDFLIGYHSVIEAKQSGLTFELTVGPEDFNSQFSEVAVLVQGQGARLTWWLLNYQAKWP